MNLALGFLLGIFQLKSKLLGTLIILFFIGNAINYIYQNYNLLFSIGSIVIGLIIIISFLGKQFKQK